MTRSEDRPVSVLDRPTEPNTALYDRYSDMPAAVPGARRAVPAARPDSAAAVPVGKRVPRGWGSHEERRLMLCGVAGFFLLGIYAAAFVLLGAVAWS